MEFKRVLILAPHTDDAELGCGGTIVRMGEQGTEVFIAVFSTAEESIPAHMPKDILKREFMQAAATMGIASPNAFVYDYPVRRLSYYRQEVLEELVALRRKIEPDLVLLPSHSDVHQDHQVLSAEGMRAFKDLSLLGYELPWNHTTFSAQAFVRLERHHLDRKWAALQAYQSQFDLKRPYFRQEFIDGLARVRGVQVKAEYAEAFEVMRIRL